MSNQFSRRDFIKLIGAGAASATFSGCATTPATPIAPDAPTKPIGRVIVIGGGFGGATAARYIRMWSEGRIEVLLIERETQFVSCPLSNLVVGGSLEIADITLGYDKLRDQSVHVIRDEVTGIDVAKKRIQLKRVADLQYDRLVVAPGVDFIYESIAGLEKPEAQKTVLHAWKAGPETVALRRQLEEMADGGVYVLSIPRAPFRCPPGPYERACQVANYFKQAKPKSKVVVLDANEDIISKKGLFFTAWNELYKGIIDYQPNQEAREVDYATKTLKTDFDSFNGDVLNVIPPMRAGLIAAHAKLITANNRWCGVDWLTMESVAAPGVHVLGDATLSAPAMPKSASMANDHAKICASAIVAMMTGKPVNDSPVIVNACYSYLSPTEVAHVTSVHRYDPAQKTLVTVQGSGGLSARRNETEKPFADAWARNIWADTLG